MAGTSTIYLNVVSYHTKSIVNIIGCYQIVLAYWLMGYSVWRAVLINTFYFSRILLIWSTCLLVTITTSLQGIHTHVCTSIPHTLFHSLCSLCFFVFATVIWILAKNILVSSQSKQSFLSVISFLHLRDNITQPMPLVRYTRTIPDH